MFPSGAIQEAQSRSRITKNLDNLQVIHKQFTIDESLTNNNQNANVVRKRLSNQSESEATIYRNAINKRTSSSSEEGMDTSDELLEMNLNNVHFVPGTGEKEMVKPSTSSGAAAAEGVNVR